MPAIFTPLHAERGRDIRRIVTYDMVQRSLSFEQAVESLARELEIEVESVKLAIAIANEADAADGRVGLVILED